MLTAAPPNWMQITDSCWFCRPTQEVLDAVEGDVEGQEKVLCLSLTAYVSLLLDRPVLVVCCCLCAILSTVKRCIL